MDGGYYPSLSAKEPPPRRNADFQPQEMLSLSPEEVHARALHRARERRAAAGPASAGRLIRARAEGRVCRFPACRTLA